MYLVLKNVGRFCIFDYSMYSFIVIRGQFNYIPCKPSLVVLKCDNGKNPGNKENGINIILVDNTVPVPWSVYIVCAALV